MSRKQREWQREEWKQYVKESVAFVRESLHAARDVKEQLISRLQSLESDMWHKFQSSSKHQDGRHQDAGHQDKELMWDKYEQTIQDQVERVLHVTITRLAAGSGAAASPSSAAHSGPTPPARPPTPD